MLIRKVIDLHKCQNSIKSIANWRHSFNSVYNVLACNLNYKYKVNSLTMMEKQNQKANAVAFDIDIKSNQEKLTPAKLKVKERFEQRLNSQPDEN